MPTMQIGRTEIAYELRRSATTTERRITVTRSNVEVTVLSTDNDDDIAGFLFRKRQWLFNTMRDMERINSSRHVVPRFMTGSKIPYRGRNMPLTVRRSDAERAIVVYRNGFFVDLPYWTGEDPGRLVASELKQWLRQRARRDVTAMVRAIGKKHSLVPRSIRVADMANGWGACGPEGNVSINWHLVFAPRKVLEYVVAHELAHLRHRSHGAHFWNYVGTLTPNWMAAKAWLDQHQASLTADFLIID